MKSRCWFVFLFALGLHAAEEGFVPLFNGTDLSSWVNVNCAPTTFTVRDGTIVGTGKPTGVMRTQNNIWCWPVGSGEVWGYREETNRPPEIRAALTPKAKADKTLGEWNRFRITMKGDRLTVVLNGKVVIENAQLPGIPARGPIALQHHGDPIQFSNFFIKDLN